MKRLIFATLFVCLSLQFACTKGTESKTEAAREPVRITDSDLEQKITDQLKADPQLRDTNLSVDADADQKLVTLSGTVESEAMRTRALELARAAHPGLTINDKIDVKPRVVSRSEYTPEMARTEVDTARSHKETVGGSVDDAWIHAKIVAQLLTDKDTPERKINVDVDHNVVTLRGTVDTITAKEEAERIAKQTEGVKRVNNMLKVSRT
jgi:hyperosmotically inducible periplasmic protein